MMTTVDEDDNDEEEEGVKAGFVGTLGESIRSAPPPFAFAFDCDGHPRQRGAKKAAAAADQTIETSTISGTFNKSTPEHSHQAKRAKSTNRPFDDEVPLLDESK